MFYAEIDSVSVSRFDERSLFISIFLSLLGQLERFKLQDVYGKFYFYVKIFYVLCVYSELRVFCVGLYELVLNKLSII